MWCPRRRKHLLERKTGSLSISRNTPITTSFREGFYQEKAPTGKEDWKSIHLKKYPYRTSRQYCTATAIVLEADILYIIFLPVCVCHNMGWASICIVSPIVLLGTVARF